MPDTRDFFSKEDEAAILSAIVEAERQTSGEIRVHLENTCNEDPVLHAQKVFQKLGMQKTKERNAILFYIAVKDHYFAIWGDEGIHQKSPSDFWQKISDKVLEHFRKGEFRQGLVEGILLAGEELKKDFPASADDSNELTDEISRS